MKLNKTKCSILFPLAALLSGTATGQYTAQKSLFSMEKRGSALTTSKSQLRISASTSASKTELSAQSSVAAIVMDDGAARSAIRFDRGICEWENNAGRAREYRHRLVMAGTTVVSFTSSSTKSAVSMPTLQRSLKTVVSTQIGFMPISMTTTHALITGGRGNDLVWSSDPQPDFPRVAIGGAIRLQVASQASVSLGYKGADGVVQGTLQQIDDTITGDLAASLDPKAHGGSLTAATAAMSSITSAIADPQTYLQVAPVLGIVSTLARKRLLALQ